MHASEQDKSDEDSDDGEEARTNEGKTGMWSSFIHSFIRLFAQ